MDLFYHCHSELSGGSKTLRNYISSRLLLWKPTKNKGQPRYKYYVFSPFQGNVLSRMQTLQQQRELHKRSKIGSQQNSTLYVSNAARHVSSQRHPLPDRLVQNHQTPPRPCPGHPLLSPGLLLDTSTRCQAGYSDSANKQQLAASCPT